MTNTKADFAKRVTEVEQYFVLLKAFDAGDSWIKSIKIDGSTIEIRVVDDQLKMLKANCFLILYNLVESTVRNSLEEIFSEVGSQGLAYKDLSDRLKTLWIEQYIVDFKEGNSRFDRIRDLFKEFANDLLASKPISMTQRSIAISGNIDGREIHSLSTKFGISHVNIDGSNLVIVKNKRNKLAHGELTFCDVGKDYSHNDLESVKSGTVDFLSAFILEVEGYLLAASYR